MEYYSVMNNNWNNITNCWYFSGFSEILSCNALEFKDNIYKVQRFNRCIENRLLNRFQKDCCHLLHWLQIALGRKWTSQLHVSSWCSNHHCKCCSERLTLYSSERLKSVRLYLQISHRDLESIILFFRWQMHNLSSVC